MKNDFYKSKNQKLDWMKNGFYKSKNQKLKQKPQTKAKTTNNQPHN